MEAPNVANANVVGLAAGSMPNEAKYQKLASEYAKLRAQASVLKKAVLEEQSKGTTLREQLRQRETSLRRTEQEVDSLGFRNKQLEHRVAALQDELAKQEGRKRDKDQKRGSSKTEAEISGSTGYGANGSGGFSIAGADESAQDALIFEELQKKIMENAQLTNLIDDKERDLQLHMEHVLKLEHTLEKRTTEHSDLEKRLRRDLEILQNRNSELETKLVEAASMLGSEDALSVSGSDHTPLHNMQSQHVVAHHALSNAPSSLTAAAAHTNEDRMALLEKEVLHWRTQYEIAKLNEAFCQNNRENMEQQNDGNCCCSTMAAAALTIKPSFVESKSAQRDSLKEPPAPPSKEQLIYNNFSKKYEDLLKAKCLAESRISSYETEAEHLQNCLENATHELKAKDEQIQNISQALQVVDEDLATTRENYEEQISVLTEQVISLSEQLAACK